MKTFALIVVFLIVVQASAAAIGRARITQGHPTKLADLRSLGDVIKKANSGANRKSVHIIVVHGMLASGPGESATLIAALKKFIGDARREVTPETKRFQLEPWPKGAKVGDVEIWKQHDDWIAGQPFVDRYTLHGSKGETVIIDEVNWWPLLFPLKCRMLVLPEARVAGAHKQQIENCRRDKWPYHRWIDDAQYQEAMAARPALGGAAAANKYLKQQILNWGMSDAVIATGPMKSYINATMEAAFDHASNDGGAAEFVVISASLGSFAVLDAFARDTPSVKAIMDRTYNLYFFANQLALLELARIRPVPDLASHVDPANSTGSSTAASVAPQTVQPDSPLSALKAWASADKQLSATNVPPDQSQVKQIIAFSDPSDALTFEVPKIGDAKVSNVYVRNAVSWFGLFADPMKAHTGHLSNRALWEAMLRISGDGSRQSGQ